MTEPRDRPHYTDRQRVDLLLDHINTLRQKLADAETLLAQLFDLATQETE